MTETTVEQDKSRLCEIIKEFAYFQEKIILSSGKESDFYIDARRITLRSEGVTLAARIIFDMIQDEIYDSVGGPTVGADPILGALCVIAHQNNSPMKSFIVRKAPKAYGKKQQIEGPPLEEGQRVILIDDVATTGKAFLESLDVLGKMNIIVDKAICIVDRNEGAREAVASKGCELISIFDASDIHTP